jgi:proteasome lid subunit RPN8/RPN11
MINKLSKKIKKNIKRHSLETFPNECCGIISLVNGKHQLIKCENVARDRQNNFQISARDYLKASRQGGVKAYYHSHTDDSKGGFSEMDKKNSQGHKLPLLMYSTKEHKLFEYIP